VVESDFQVVVSLLNNDCPSYHPCFPLIKSILNQNRLKCILTWSHILWEANQIADSLTKFGLSIDSSTRIFDYVSDLFYVKFCYY